MVPEVSSIAALIGEPKRATILVALLDGRAMPAGELAFQANVAPQTASEHLAKLVDGKLLAVQTLGRHRYYRLASPEVADALEALAGLVPPPKPLPRLESEQNRELRFARTCYNHLAGKAAVALNEELLRRGYLIVSATREYTLTDSGHAWMRALGVDLGTVSHKSSFARACLDWTERRYHLAGPLGSALLRRMFELKWLARINDTRAVRFTVKGREQLGRMLDLALR